MIKTSILKKICMYVILSIVVVIIPVGASAAAYTSTNVIIDENFNRYSTGSTPSWWLTDKSGGNITVAEVPSPSNKSTYLNDTSTTTSVNLNATFPAQTGTVTVEAAIMLPVKSNSHKLLRLASSNGVLAFSIETVSGNLSYRNADNTYQTIISNYSANTWYNLKVVANQSTKKADVYVNNSLIISQATFYASPGNIAKIESFTPNSGASSHYIDNIKVYTTTTVSNPNYVVAKDGSGNYTTIQAAVNAVSANNPNRTVIFVKNGTYQEVVTVAGVQKNVSLIGESSTGTKISYNNYASKLKPDGTTYGTNGSATLFVLGPDFIAENITVENTYDESLGASQAVAAYITGDRQKFNNCRFLGNQDTLWTVGGRQYYNKCYIEGDVDFIFGAATAVFDDCEIFTVARTGGGYDTAASTDAGIYGYLFTNCRVKGATANDSTWLGRPWRANANVVYKNCYLGAHIRVNGWTDMSGNLAANARFYEYKNTGPGAVINSYRRQLTDSEALTYTKSNLLAGSDGWNP